MRFLPEKCVPFLIPNNFYGTTAQQPLAWQNFTNDCRAVIGALRMGRAGLSRQYPVFSGQPKCQIQPNLFAQNTLGAERSGRFVRVDVQVKTTRKKNKMEGIFAVDDFNPQR